MVEENPGNNSDGAVESKPDFDTGGWWLEYWFAVGRKPHLRNRGCREYSSSTATLRFGQVQVHLLEQRCTCGSMLLDD